MRQLGSQRIEITRLRRGRVPLRRDDGPDLLTFTEAGALGRSGFNAAGIAITANYLRSDRDYAWLMARS